MTSHDPGRSLRVVFAGTPDFAAHHLQALITAGQNIAGVFTQPDRPAGRGKKLAASPVKLLAIAHDLPVFQPDTLKTTDSQQPLIDLQPDVMVVVAYGLLLPTAVLAIPRHGCINVHASLLPRWRGAAPIQRAIEAGDRETGVTIMQMDAGLDTGAMLSKVRCAIGEHDTGGSLHDRLAEIGPPALLATLEAIAAGTLQAEPQDDSLSNYAPKISKQEATIDWQQGADAIARKVRAFNPFPVAHTLIDGQTLRIWQAEPVATANRQQPGTVVATGDDSVTVACGEGALVIRAAQLPGKKRLAMADILRGHGALFSPGRRLGGEQA